MKLGKMPFLTKVYAPPRILLFPLAVFLKLTSLALSAIGFVLGNTWLLALGTIIWLVWFAVLFRIAMPTTDRLLQGKVPQLKRASANIFILLLIAGLTEVILISSIGLGVLPVDGPGENQSKILVSFAGLFGYNDVTALWHQAADNLIQGKNPYVEVNVVSAMTEFNGLFDKLIPVRVGRFANAFPYPDMRDMEKLWKEVSKNPEVVPPEFHHKLGYPAGCFLLAAPFIWLGLGDFRLVYLIFIVPALAYALWLTPANLKIFLLGGIFICIELWSSLAAGETGLLYFPFLLIGWVMRRKNFWFSVSLIAMAASIKQVAWFFIPFFFILILKTMGWKKALLALATIIGIFAAVNAHFILADPKLWLASLLAPVTENLFPSGIGLITLVTGGILDIHSPWVFTALEIAAAALALAWYSRNCLRYPHTGPLLSVLPLFFAWRSMWGYFFFVDIIVLAAVIIDEYGGTPSQEATQERHPAIVVK